MQAVTVTIRALATRELDTINKLYATGKEIAVAAVNGIVFAIVLGSMAALWFHEINLGLVLGGAMIFNILWAGLAGATLPILIAHLGKDPALSAGPLLTTTDVLGFAFFWVWPPCF